MSESSDEEQEVTRRLPVSPLVTVRQENWLVTRPTSPLLRGEVLQ